MNPEARPAREYEQGGVRLTVFENGEILSVVLVSRAKIYSKRLGSVVRTFE
jgi:hypothetical protein